LSASEAFDDEKLDYESLLELVICYRLTSFLRILRLHELGLVELCIDLIDYFTILALKYPLPEALQRAHQSANNKMADETAGGRLSGTPI
jgi:hypothetical protein